MKYIKDQHGLQFNRDDRKKEQAKRCNNWEDHNKTTEGGKPGRKDDLCRSNDKLEIQHFTVKGISECPDVARKSNMMLSG